MSWIGPSGHLDAIYFDDGRQTISFVYHSTDVNNAVGHADADADLTPLGLEIGTKTEGLVPIAIRSLSR